MWGLSPIFPWQQEELPGQDEKIMEQNQFYRMNDDDDEDDNQ